MSNTPNVIKKTVDCDGDLLHVLLAELDGQECISTTRFAELLGVSKTNLMQVMTRNGIKPVTPSYKLVPSLRKDNVIGLRGSAPGFLTQQDVQTLVKIIDTPQAWAIYEQLWQQQVVVKELTQEVKNLNNLTSDMMLAVAAQLKVMEMTVTEARAESELLRAELQDRRNFPLLYVLQDAYVAKEMKKDYPSIWFLGMRYKRENEAKYRENKYNDAGWVSMFLQTTQGVTSRVQECMTEHNRYLYNKVDIDAAEARCLNIIRQGDRKRLTAMG